MILKHKSVGFRKDSQWGGFFSTFVGATILSVLPSNSWFWGGTLSMSHCAAAWRRPTSFVSERRTKEREGGRQTEREGQRQKVVGIEILSEPPLFQGLGNRAHRTNEK